MSMPLAGAPCPICEQHSALFLPHPDAVLLRCIACGHVFAELETVEELEDYDLSYGDEDHQNWFENPNVALFDRIDRHLAVAGVESVLDVGCGRADLLLHLGSRHPDWRLAGVEQTEFAPPPGIEMAFGRFVDVGFDGQFDAVVSLAVIEHVQDPVAFLRHAIELSRPGGRIVVMTLNERSVLYGASRALRRVGMSGPFDQLYAKHHLHHFGKRSLEACFEAAGLTVEDRYDHNIPAAAIDFPPSGVVSDAVRRSGARACFALGAMTRQCYLQTVYASVPG